MLISHWVHEEYKQLIVAVYDTPKQNICTATFAIEGKVLGKLLRNSLSNHTQCDLLKGIYESNLIGEPIQELIDLIDMYNILYKEY